MKRFKICYILLNTTTIFIFSFLTSALFFVDVDLTKVISIEKQKKQVLTTYVVGIYLIKHKPIISEL